MAEASESAGRPPGFTMAEAALEAFRDRGRRGVLIGATIAYFVLALLLTGLFVASVWSGYLDYFTWVLSVMAQAGREAPPKLSLPPASVLSVWPVVALFQVVYFILLAAYEAACLRWLIRGETGGLFGLTLGPDTWRIWASYWVWLALGVGYVIGVGLIGLIAGLGAAAAHANEAFVALLIVLGVAAFFASIVWLAVRLAPAAAASIVHKRFAFFDAWKATRGRFWTLFGAFLLICIAAYAADTVTRGAAFYFVFGAVWEVIAQMAAGGAPPKLQDIIGIFTAPRMLAGLGVVIVLAAIIGALMGLAFFGVNARAVLAAKEEGRF